MRSFRAALVAAALLAIISQPARADTSGLLRGTVTLDEKPAAGVALTLRGEGTTATTESNAKGEFVFTRVAFGRYALTAHKAGVDDVTHQIELLSGSVSAVNLDLHTLHEIAHTQSGLTRGVASSPVAVNTLGRAQISTLPNNQSLDSLVATMPGIVRFSYNEPIAHGFHGVTYEIDGVPLPQGTASNFGEIIDPRTIDSFEVFTGAFPAEYGGSRQGAIVNIVSHRATDVTAPEAGYVSFGGGNYGSAQTSIGEALAISSNTRLFINTNSERTDRGLDSPTFDPQHDASSNTNQFLRTITNITKHDTLALDLSNNYATFQVPINTVTTPIAPVAVPRGTDDVQREYDQFANLVYTHTSADENSYTLVAPWYRYDRVVYAGDLPSDLQGTFTDFSQDPPAVTPLDGLRQDRSSEFTGLRLAHFHVFGPNAVKAGIDTSVENFVGTSQLAYYDSSGVQQNFFDNAAQKGSLFSAYVQDKWTPNHYISVFGGLRFDHSTGYTSGAQLSPRIEFDGQFSPQDIFHAYYGRLYSAPFLEDTRREAVVIGTGSPGELPFYDLKPERDSYYEVGIAHQFTPGVRGYINLWRKNAQDVLDTTQIFPTPIFAVYNNTVGVAQGIEARLDGRLNDGDTFFLSTTLSNSQAAGISGGTFLFCPTPTTGCLAGLQDLTLQPEDHDQAYNLILDYTKRLGRDRSFYVSFEPQYGTGYPVQFQNGAQRLAPSLIFNASVGRDVKRGSIPAIGFVADFQNIANNAYLIKVNNGFNTTQWAPGFRSSFRLILPF